MTAEEKPRRQQTFADWLRKVQEYGRPQGVRIGEHSQFGGVSPVHAPNSHHDYDEAADITIWGADVGPAYEGGEAKSWQQRTGEKSWRMKQLAKAGLLTQVLGPGDEGHGTHVHVAKEGDFNGLDSLVFDRTAQWAATGRWKDDAGALQSSNPYALTTPATTATAATAPTAAPAEPDWRAAASDPQRSISPGDPRYWERKDMQLWAEANPKLASAAMVSAGVPLNVEDRGALGGTQIGRVRVK